MKRTPASVSVTLILISLIAAFWFIYAIILMLGVNPALPSAGVVKWVIFILALGTSVVMAGIVIFLRARKRFAFYFGVVLLTIIAVLSITDEVGLSDLVVLLASLITLGLLIKDRAWHLHAGISEKSVS